MQFAYEANNYSVTLGFDVANDRIGEVFTGLAATDPVRRKRATQRIAELALTSNAAAASRQDAPASTASTTRSRKSWE